MACNNRTIAWLDVEEGQVLKYNNQLNITIGELWTSYIPFYVIMQTLDALPQAYAAQDKIAPNKALHSAFRHNKNKVFLYFITKEN